MPTNIPIRDFNSSQIGFTCLFSLSILPNKLINPLVFFSECAKLVCVTVFTYYNGGTLNAN